MKVKVTGKLLICILISLGVNFLIFSMSIRAGWMVTGKLLICILISLGNFLIFSMSIRAGWMRTEIGADWTSLPLVLTYRMLREKKTVLTSLANGLYL